jgi:hypothetical protein
MENLVELAGTKVKYDSSVLSAGSLRAILDVDTGLGPDEDVGLDIPSSIRTADDAFAFAWAKINEEQPDFNEKLRSEGKSREDLLAHFKSVLEGPLPDDPKIPSRPKWTVNSQNGQFLHTLGDETVLVTESALESKALELVFKGIEVVFDLTLLLIAAFAGPASSAAVAPETEEAEQTARADASFCRAIRTFVRNNTALLDAGGLKGTKDKTKLALALVGWFRGLGGTIPKVGDLLTKNLHWWQIAVITASLASGLALMVATAGGTSILRIVACAALLLLTVADIIAFVAIVAS